MQMLPRTLPENLDDLTVQVALVRPGPIQGGAVHPYIERRERLREDPDYEVPYEHPSLEPVLSDTLGAIVFQDQVLQVAMALAGFSAGEAEGLRRAMSRKRSEAAIARLPRALHRGRGRARRRAGGRRAGLRAGARLLRLRLPEGARGRLRPARLPVDLAAGALRAGVPVRAAERAADGLLSAGRARPRGAAARDRGAAAGRRTASGVECRVERAMLARADRARLRDRRCARTRCKRVVAERERGGRYGGLGRSGVAVGRGPRHARAAGLGGGVRVDRRARRARREALWQLGRRWRLGVAAEVGAGGAALAAARPARGARAARADDWERLVADYGSTGMTLGEHPMALMRPEPGAGLASSGDLERAAGRRPSWRSPGWWSRASGPATARGVMFMLLEDESGRSTWSSRRPSTSATAWRCGRRRSCG